MFLLGAWNFPIVLYTWAKQIAFKYVNQCLLTSCGSFGERILATQQHVQTQHCLSFAIKQTERHQEVIAKCDQFVRQYLYPYVKNPLPHVPVADGLTGLQPGALIPITDNFFYIHTHIQKDPFQQPATF